MKRKENRVSGLVAASTQRHFQGVHLWRISARFAKMAEPVVIGFNATHNTAYELKEYLSNGIFGCQPAFQTTIDTEEVDAAPIMSSLTGEDGFLAELLGTL
jgi:hypothetical protein